MTAVLLLAAGQSSRMGQPKQLLDLGGKTLLQQVAGAILDAPYRPLVVVLGAYAPQIAPLLAGMDLVVVHHPHWRRGLGSSIAAGMRALLAQPPFPRGVILAVADQPALSPQLLQELVDTQRRTGAKLVASRYGSGTLGTPLWVADNLFGELLALDGPTGARILLQRYPQLLATVPFPAGDLDLDTPEDWQNWPQKVD